jgi:hypothetical protein
MVRQGFRNACRLIADDRVARGVKMRGRVAV